MKMVGVSGALIGSKTANIVNEVLFAARRVDSSIQTNLLDLKEYDVEFVRGTPLSYYNDDTIQVVNTILDADIILFGTPIYQASITGALKNLFDHMPTDAFQRKVTGMVSTGGTDKHFLVPEYQLKPILTFLKGVVPVGNVFVHNDYFNDESEITNKDVITRLNKLAKEMIVLQKSIENQN